MFTGFICLLHWNSQHITLMNKTSCFKTWIEEYSLAHMKRIYHSFSCPNIWWFRLSCRQCLKYWFRCLSCVSSLYYFIVTFESENVASYELIDLLMFAAYSNRNVVQAHYSTIVFGWKYHRNDMARLRNITIFEPLQQ